MSMPKWIQPEGIKTNIQLTNSLTRSKQELILKSKDARKIGWYMCGPTVYDMSHLGHARTYVAFDIIRRILEDYFQYEVDYVLNVTDVDDKIIRKSNLVLAWELLELALKASDKPSETVARIQARLEEDKVTKDREKQAKTIELVQIIKELKAEPVFEKNQQVQDLKPDFKKIARKFENHFWEDMKKLDVKYPSSITRVSEYAPQIVSFVEQIIKNGYAYESNGSVYFDTVAFNTAPHHDYGKLMPESTSQVDQVLDGEGEWAEQNANVADDKKNSCDFALWKKSNPGEPSWDSPWGMGRPGWHIECSAMASDMLTENFDIHSGGVDLKFPHHDNELAQSEACYDHSQWVNYFLHAGHLHIEGKTMSKSKKNFITIREALESYNPKQIRMLFLLKDFSSPMNYSLAEMDSAKALERFFANFFQNVQALEREQTANPGPIEHWMSDDDRELAKALSNASEKTHTYLSDDFNTKAVLDLLQELVRQTNVYLGKVSQPRLSVVMAVASFITRMFRVFGLINANDIGFSAGGSGEEKEMTSNLLNVMTGFRDDIRSAASSLLKQLKDPEQKKAAVALLDLCDRVRDVDLPPLGVRLEDKAIGTPSVWKLEDPEALQTEIRRKKEQEAKKLAKKKAAAEEAARKEAEQRIAPEFFFLGKSYGSFDASGMPLTDEAGEPLNKSATKKATKLYKGQLKKFTKSIAKLNKKIKLSKEVYVPLYQLPSTDRVAIAKAVRDNTTLGEFLQPIVEHVQESLENSQVPRGATYAFYETLFSS